MPMCMSVGMFIHVCAERTGKIAGERVLIMVKITATAGVSAARRLKAAALLRLRGRSQMHLAPKLLNAFLFFK